MPAARNPQPRPQSPLPLNARMRANDLAEVTFAQLLVELHETRETGSLLIHVGRASDGEPLRAAIYFEAGQPLAVIAENCNARGVRPVLVALCGLSRGRFEFVETHDLVGDRGARAAEPVDAFEVVAAAMRGPAVRGGLRLAQQAIGLNLVRLHSGVDLRRYGFSEEEGGVAAALAAGPADLSRLRAKSGASDAVLLPTLTTLWLTRALTVLAPERRTTSGTVRVGVPAGAPRDLGARARARSSTVSVPVRPSTVSVPVRPSTVSVPVRSSTVSVPARPSTVSVPARANTRSNSADTARTAVAQRESLPPLTDATSQHKLFKAAWSNIELMVQRRQYHEALQAAIEALKQGEALPEHQALLGWIIYQHSGAGEEAHPKVWSLLQRALRRDPLCEKALYYKALVLKRTGRNEQACAHLERLLLVNPKHIEAVREVRLYRMRSRRQHSGLRRLFSGSEESEE